jgi:hypothetical protein
MKRNIVAYLSIVSVMAIVGWKLATHPAVSAGLHDISLVPRSEHSHTGPTHELAGIRIRLSPTDFDYEIGAREDQVPQISLAAE